MKKIFSFLAVILVSTSACSNDAISKVAENDSLLAPNTSVKKLNVTDKKTGISSNYSAGKEKLFIKDLPKNFIFVPLTRQATDYTCGVGVLQSVLMYYGDEYREDELAKALKSDPNEGTGYHNIAEYSKSLGYKATILKDMTIDQLKKLIDNKKPVMVLLQAWPDKPVDYSKDWDDGHYSIAIGYDDKKIYFMDPSTLGYYTFIPTEQFLTRWHDTDGTERLTHFGLIVEKASPKYNRNEVLKMD
jgi:predicted double-glycine peptidase